MRALLSVGSVAAGALWALSALAGPGGVTSTGSTDSSCPLPASGPDPAAGKCANPLPSGVKLDMTAITAWLKANPGISSLDTIVPCLPKEYRSNYTLIYDSKSPHGVCGGVTSPRIVFFNSDASSVISIPGDAPKLTGNETPEQKQEIQAECNTVETFSFDPGTARYTSGSVSFTPPPGTAPANPVTNPASCVSCHGADFHVKWDRYPAWPGAFGGQDDTLRDGTPEMAMYKSYAKRVATPGAPGRYQYFVNTSGSDTPPFLHATASGAADLTNVAARPNLRLSGAFTRQNDERLERILSTAPDYDKGKYRVAAELLGCSNYPMTEAQKAAVTARVPVVASHFQSDLNAQLCREAADLGSPNSAYCTAGDKCLSNLPPINGKSNGCYTKEPGLSANVLPEARTLVLMEGLGLSPSALGSVGSNSAAPPEPSLDIFGRMPGRMASYMVMDIAKSAPGVRAANPPNDSCANRRPAAGGKFLSGTSSKCVYGQQECLMVPDQSKIADSALCKAIKDVDPNTQAGTNANPCPPPPPPVAVTPVNLRSVEQIVQNKCVSCHSAQKGRMDLRFNTSSDLAAALKSDPGLASRYRNNISSGYMPADDTLTPAEKNMMLNLQ